MTKGVIYYSDCRGDRLVLDTVRTQLRRAAGDRTIVSVTLASLDPPFARPSYHWVRREPRGYVTMFRQIVEALELSSADVVFHCEHDVLYSPSHFDFTPARMDAFYFNQQTWRCDRKTGRALFYYCNQVSGLCASRALLLAHYRKILAHVEAHGFERALGFEPGGNRRQREHGVDAPVETWMSAQPNVDIKTDFCLTKGRWDPSEFRNKNSCLGWTEADAVPGWGRTKDRFDDFLADVAHGRIPQETAA